MNFVKALFKFSVKGQSREKLFFLQCQSLSGVANETEWRTNIISNLEFSVQRFFLRTTVKTEINEFSPNSEA